MRRNLVIVRAGRDSLHESWIDSPDSNRTWDLWVSSYEPIEGRRSPDALQGFQTFEAGSKLTGLAALLERETTILRDYAYIFIPDDDLMFAHGSIDILFKYMSEYDLALAQPSLSANSFISREITLHNPHALLRFTNWIESMAPCFSQSALMACASTFRLTHTGWGQEVLWCSRLRGDRIGIIDAVQATHSRPFGGPNYAQAKANGTSAVCEMLALYAVHNVSQPLLSIDGVVTSDGVMLEGNSFPKDDVRWMAAPW